MQRAKTQLETWRTVFTPRELCLLAPLNCPNRIQLFLDEIPYSTDPIYRCPRRVLSDRKAHCADGALFAAAALRRIGHPPRILEMKAHNDDVHLVALFQRRGHWGCISKSNYTGLGFREAIHRNLRELVLSYFEGFFNVEGKKTLRGYTVPLNLAAHDDLNWMTRDDRLEDILSLLDHVRVYPLLTPGMVRDLHPVNPRVYQAGLMFAERKGLYRPE